MIEPHRNVGSVRVSRTQLPNVGYRVKWSHQLQGMGAHGDGGPFESDATALWLLHESAGLYKILRPFRKGVTYGRFRRMKRFQVFCSV